MIIFRLTQNFHPYGGFSAILAQKDENDNQIPVQFASRSILASVINTTEKNWSKHEIDAGALRWGIEKYRYFMHDLMSA